MTDPTDRWNTHGKESAQFIAEGEASMLTFNGPASGTSDSQPLAQSGQASRGETNAHRPKPRSSPWPPENPHAGGSPRPPVTYAGDSVQYTTAGPPARPKNAAMAVISMSCGFAALVLGVGAQFVLFLGLAISSGGSRSIIELTSVVGGVADVATIILGVAAVTAGVVGLAQISRSRGMKRGTGMVVTGIAIGSIILILTAMVFGLALMGGM